MNFKKLFAVQNKRSNDLENLNDYPTIADLIKDQNVPSNKDYTVHHRRDLDSLG